MKASGYLTLIVLSLLVLSPTAPCETGLKGGELLALTFPAPEDPSMRSYLGVEGSGGFRLADIDATVLIVEIFSMYCPFCQREAPNVNRFFDLIEADEALGSRVKLIGIGVGNTDFEVNYFKETYTIGFPLFSDSDFSIHKLLGEVRTPYFIGFRLDRSPGEAVFLSRPGELGDVEAFLKTVLADSGLEN